ncbi:MAG: DUF1624 domain-containing protein [Proteobacteria bacterium]|nr:DUF1624 domain-containing protein [Pseudomonadota bacterium]
MADPPSSPAPRIMERFLALDVFRGLAVALMIIVNTPGPGARPWPILVHARWFGFTAADWVFPSFLFAVGCSMVFAFCRPVGPRAFAARVLRRAALIFLLGFLMYWYPFVRHGPAGWGLIPFATTRITGVLQRIALCYLLAAFATRWLEPRRLIALSAALLLGYWAILVAWNPGDPFSKFGNAGTRLDLALIGPAHLYKRDGGFDPEGLLGTLPATVNVIAGYLAARFLTQAPDRPRAFGRMAAVGLALTLTALVWSPFFPIAKKLWTGSFVLLTVGLDLVVLAALAAWLEGRQPDPASRFLRVFGRNPIVIYLFSELFVTTLDLAQATPGQGLYDWIGEAVFQPLAPGPLGALLCAIAYTFACWLLGWLMDRKGWTVRL